MRRTVPLSAGFSRCPPARPARWPATRRGAGCPV